VHYDTPLARSIAAQDVNIEVTDEDAMSVFDDIVQQTFADMRADKVLRAQYRKEELLEIRRREREDAPTPVGSSTCDQCGGIIFPNPSMSGNRFQPCTTCNPTKEIGEASVVDRDSTRRSVARADGQKTFVSLTPCKQCGDSEPRRYCVGERCVVCVTAAYEDDPTEPLPVAIPMRENLQHAPPKKHEWRKMVQRDKPVYPVSYANRSAAKEANAVKFEAVDHPCATCGGTERYTSDNTCAYCRIHRKTHAAA
jgi:hypothetical protein